MGQDFFINKKSTLPILKMELVNDGRNDFRNFHDKIQNATIKFTMWDLSNNAKRIANSDGKLELKDDGPNQEEINKSLHAGAQFWIVKSDDIEPRLEQFREDYEGYKNRTAPFKVYK